jgi:hypothetical protein
MKDLNISPLGNGFGLGIPGSKSTDLIEAGSNLQRQCIKGSFV